MWFCKKELPEKRKQHRSDSSPNSRSGDRRDMSGMSTGFGETFLARSLFHEKTKNGARNIVMNNPTGILTGTGPPLPRPGFPPGPTKEEIRERQRQEQPWLDRLAREWDAKVKREQLEAEAEAGSDSP
ncbi:hypothetical protein GJ744_004287 [Endocarpon pusillum]|uniref:Uncharacterized protein n=1 Tax=Endocarpon pusillum TaxID=364733 RepID=A0A8H7A5R1_9EURO|nr:hypothetical protein GJ744_004287 [Endocarpon pusillum]